MKTAAEWAARIKASEISKEPWAKLVGEIQHDARRQGMTDAADIVHDEGLFQMSESILAARDVTAQPND